MSEQKKDDFKMEYRMLGNTGLKVSTLGLGTMSFDSVDQAIELMEAVRSFGVNFFDNAELYGEPVGNGEIIFGKALKMLQIKDPKLWRRSGLVITTKLFFGPGDGKQANSPIAQRGVNEAGLSRKHLMEGISASLERLQLEYVDVLMAHRYDNLTSMKEIVEGFTDIIRSGKAFYWGTSMWPAHKIIEAYWVAQCYNLEPPICDQPIYNMFFRKQMEKELLPVFDAQYKIGTTVFSPLDAGILTGKYNDKSKVDKDSRMGGGKNRLGKWWTEDNLRKDKLDKVAKLIPIAKELGVSMVALAIGWTIKNKNVSVCLLGGRKASQLLQNKDAITAATKLNKETMKKIDDILGNAQPPLNAWNGGPLRFADYITDPM